MTPPPATPRAWEVVLAHIAKVRDLAPLMQFTAPHVTQLERLMPRARADAAKQV